MVKRDVTKEASISYSSLSLWVYKTAGRHYINCQEESKLEGCGVGCQGEM